ncbi:lemA [Prevotella sp. CAG:617]|jgi:LemA protein|nr:lemA [Prevotella sp. CAG:617]
MKKTYIVWAVVALVVLILIAVPWTSYNSMVTNQETVTTAWSNVESQYQRRADLIPNLVNTVKGYATHERETLEGVMNARAKATQVTVDPTQLTPEKLQQFQQAQGQLSTALGRLMMVAENYPNLKANENFSELQAQLEGTENRINESRRLYNEAVQVYNVGIRRFPAVIFARMFGFEPQTKFEADKAAEKAPEVKF